MAEFREKVSRFEVSSRHPDRLMRAIACMLYTPLYDSDVGNC